jgi:hypothetical protein
MLLILYQKLIITLVLREKPICFAENWWKIAENSYRNIDPSYIHIYVWLISA